MGNFLMHQQNRQSSFLELYQKLHGDETQRGKQFERICKWFLQNDPEYKRQLKRVWLWDEWPHRWGRDKGIDLVAEDFDGKIWAIQAKAYAPQHSSTKHDRGQLIRACGTGKTLIGLRVAEAIKAQRTLLLVPSLISQVLGDWTGDSLHRADPGVGGQTSRTHQQMAEPAFRQSLRCAG